MVILLLSMALQIGVPVCIETALSLEPKARARLLAIWGEHAGQAITSHGDAILYRDPGTAANFAHLARGLAVLSFAPGGVHAFDRLWCATHYVWSTTGMRVCDVCAPPSKPSTTDYVRTRR